jgi:hypothetical protein
MAAASISMLHDLSREAIGATNCGSNMFQSDFFIFIAASSNDWWNLRPEPQVDSPLEGPG